MRKLHINAVQPGYTLARTVHMENGSVLLGAGMKLNERFIERLRTLGIDTLYIEDSVSEGIEPVDIISDDTRKQAISTVHKTMTDLMNQSALPSRASIPNIGSTFRNVFSQIMSELSGRTNMMLNLANMHIMDGYLFHHSVNVAILSCIVGISKGYNRNQLMELGVGAMLFDVGMTKVPSRLLKKAGRLTEEERKEIENHTVLGFDLLRSQHDVSLLSAHCALQHHERYTGNGYPRELKGTAIHEYAQIVGLADVYDALVSPRAYRPSYTPADAAEFLYGMGNDMFDLDLLRLFFRHIAIYPVASSVVLNTGQTGVVASVDPIQPNRPVVRVIQEAGGSPVRAPYELDLKSTLNVTIVQTL